MPNILIDLAAEFTGKKAFDKAGKSTTSLEKSVKSLGRTFGVTFGTAAVLAYGKASVKAASDDIKAQKQLALALKNVGLERDAATAEGYIQKLESEFGVVDDKLRPAYASLAIAIRNTAETQRILGIALDISASTGRDLESVVAALSKAYLGNNTSLGKLGVGIAKADLKTKSFKEITDQLAVTFAGSAQASADSFAGSIDKLSIASNNAKEIIGTSLIGALTSLGNDKSIDNLSTSIEGAAKSLANFIDSVVYLKGQLASIPGAGVFGYLASGLGDLLGRFSPQRLAELVKAIKGFQGMGNVPMTGGSNMDLQKYEATQKKLAASKIAADKKAATAKTKADQLAASNAAKLAKAQSIFDIDKIQIEAALKGKITDEETLRLQLQRAILNEDFELANKLQKQLEASQRATAALQGQINAIKPPVNPFAEMVKSLEEVVVLLGKVSGVNAITTRKPGGGVLALEPEDLNPLVIDTKPSGGVLALEPKDSNPLIIDRKPSGGLLALEPADLNPLVPNPAVIPTPTITEPIPVVVEPSPIPATNNQFAGLGGDTSFYGGPLPWYMRSSGAAPTPVTNNPFAGLGGPTGDAITFNPSQNADRNYDARLQAPTIIVNNNGSVIMQEEFVKAVNDAVVTANTQGLVVTRPGGIRSDEG